MAWPIFIQLLHNKKRENQKRLDYYTEGEKIPKKMLTLIQYPISILGYGRGASYPSYFIFSVMWINILFGTFFLGLLPVLDECDYIFYVCIPSIFRFKSYAPTPSPGQFWQVLPNNGLWKLYLRISSKQNV